MEADSVMLKNAQIVNILAALVHGGCGLNRVPQREGSVQQKATWLRGPETSGIHTSNSQFGLQFL